MNSTSQQKSICGEKYLSLAPRYVVRDSSDVEEVGAVGGTAYPYFEQTYSEVNLKHFVIHRNLCNF